MAKRIVLTNRSFCYKRHCETLKEAWQSSFLGLREEGDDENLKQCIAL